MSAKPTIIYTHTDEAPALATYSFLPILQAFTAPAGIDVQTRDISLSGRIIAAFPDRLKPAQRQSDDLAELGRLTQSPDANIIKLPNISASVPQLKAAIAELKQQGYDLPEYPEEPKTPQEREIKAKYDKVKGSAVNPVLREGNSDRRAPKSVKAYAKKHPHRLGKWSRECKAHVASMTNGDFFGNEKSATMSAATTAKIEHHALDGKVTVLRDGIALDAGEIVDATFMSRASLLEFLRSTIEDARRSDVLWSIHLKATMMKVSDPIIFGHAVKTFYAPLFERHGALLAKVGADANNGLGDLEAKIGALPESEREAIKASIRAVYERGPGIAMVDSDRGITNLHVPSDIIIDASMPVVVRDSGCMWNAKGKLQECKAVIPDRSYAGVYATVIDFCREHGGFDPATMGSVPNVGLMAQKAEEYGSHETTFEIASPGFVRVVDAGGRTIHEHSVGAGDIWRLCRVKDAPVRDWVKLAVHRAKATGTPIVYWLDETRAHDAQVIAKVKQYMPSHDLKGVDWRILAPAAATKFSLERMKEGKDTISVTGNVLRDYLTDLFPILELGTSAKMLSIVPLMAGGGMFETGAGGSAPKHVQQFQKENYLRWDSLGEFLAMAASFEHIADRTGNGRARLLARTLDEATAKYLDFDRSPARKVGELDNRGSHFYLALYWAQALAAQKDDFEMAARFAPMAQDLTANETKIVAELNGAQGRSMDVGGYYHPDPKRCSAAMRSSATLNAIIGGVLQPA